MTLWIAWFAAALAIGEHLETIDSQHLDIPIDIQQLEAMFAQDETIAAEEIKRIEVETERSLDASFDWEMAQILHSDRGEEEGFEEMAPELEDLSYLVKRPAIKITETGETLPEGANAYERLPITVAEEQKIHNILTTMADNNVFALLFEKKRLERLGREIHHVHPVRFLGYVFSNAHLVYCMSVIHRSGFKWGGFIDGFSKRFEEERSAGNIRAYVPGLAASLALKTEEIMAYVHFNDFEGLVLYLMEKSRQK